jgi:hypothetical protein
MVTPLPDSSRFSPPVALWCPYCREPFVGTVDRATGKFVHGSCPVGRVDLRRLDDLARREWFWARFRDHVLGSSRAAEPGAAGRAGG